MRDSKAPSSTAENATRIKEVVGVGNSNNMHRVFPNSLKGASIGSRINARKGREGSTVPCLSNTHAWRRRGTIVDDDDRAAGPFACLLFVEIQPGSFPVACWTWPAPSSRPSSAPGVVASHTHESVGRTYFHNGVVVSVAARSRVTSSKRSSPGRQDKNRQPRRISSGMLSILGKATRRYPAICPLGTIDIALNRK